MIAILGSSILDEIIRRVKEAKFYAIIADETPDMSQTEQLSLLVRFVWNGEVGERLLAMMPMNETTAEALFEAVTQKLQQHGIDVAHLRGHCRRCKQCSRSAHWPASTNQRGFTFCCLYSLLCSYSQPCHCGHYEQKQDCPRFLWNVTELVCLYPVLSKVT